MSTPPDLTLATWIGHILVAQAARRPVRPAPDEALWQILVPMLWIVGLLLLLALIVAKVRAWFLRNADKETSVHQMLTEFRQLRDRGELSEEEFRTIRNRLSPQLGIPGNDPSRASLTSEDADSAEGIDNNNMGDDNTDDDAGEEKSPDDADDANDSGPADDFRKD